MYCKKCGSSLPSYGYICKNCGAMMDSEQIKIQKDYIKEKEKTRNSVNLQSDLYSNKPIKRDYSNPKDNKFIGAIIVIFVLIILILISILKVM